MAELDGIDLDAAAAFLAGHGRVLDRRRFALLFGSGDSGEAVMAALDGYRNADGGYGWGLEPDLRCAESQPGGALHAFETMADVPGEAIGGRALELCDWLEGVMLEDDGLPFALAMADPAACAPFWANADPARSSLLITGQVVAQAWRVARTLPEVGAHPWLARATSFCLGAIENMGPEPHAIEVMAALWVLDAVAHSEPGVPALLERVARHVPADGRLHVLGGADDEFLRPLDLSPYPGTSSRACLGAQVVELDRARLAGDQQPDGGWSVGFASYSPAAALEWRGYQTVRALQLLSRNATP